MIVCLFISHIHYDVFRPINCGLTWVVLSLYKSEELRYRSLLHIKIEVYNFVIIPTVVISVFVGTKVKKVNITLEQAIKVQKGSRGIVLLFL